MVEGSSQRYARLSSKYLGDAEALLGRGDFVQASEKFWGAVAEATKAAAAERRWRHSSHHDLRRAISRLYQETGDADFVRLFGIAESLHANFYEDFMEAADVRVCAEDARRIVEKLGRVDGRDEQRGWGPAAE